MEEKKYLKWYNKIGYGSGWSTQSTKSGTMGVPAAGSTMGSTSAGTTLSGPTINVTRYDSGFTDNITLSYNGKTITRNGFTSSKLSFSEAERCIVPVFRRLPSRYGFPGAWPYRRRISRFP